MQNKGTDYIRRILRDKARQKRWRQIMLCLSCIVVFCTIYVLILPAITLEKKTTCEEEEQIAIQEEQTPIQETNENTVQSTIPSDDSEDIEFVSCEPIEEETDDVDDVEIAEEPEEEMDVDFASGEEDAIAAAVDETVTPEAGMVDGFDLSADPNKIDDVKLSYKLSDSGTWQECKPDNDTVIPANAKIKLQVDYKDIQIKSLRYDYYCKLTYDLPELMRNITTEGGIFDRDNNKVGTVTCENRKITVIFNTDYLDNLQKDSQTTINGNFYAQGDVNLRVVPDTGGTTTVTTGNKTYQLNFEPDAVAKYGQISVDKTCTSSQVISTANGDYLAYTITVTAGEDGCPDVSVVDTIVSSSDCVDSYVGIGASSSTLLGSSNNQNPYETIAADKNHGTVYLGNPDSANPVPTPGAANITNKPGSMVWKIGNMAAYESRTLTYYVKLKDDVNLRNKEIKNKAAVYSKAYERAYDDTSFTPKIDYNMGKDQVGDIVRNSDGTYTISYRLDFILKKDTSNYALKNFEFRDLLDASDIHTDKGALPYISYDRNSVELYVKTDEASDYTSLSSETDYTVGWAKGNDDYITPWNDSNSNPTRFKITGAKGKPITVNPGDSYYVTYSVTVQPEALAAMKSDRVEVKNRYYAYASNAKSDSGGAFDQVWHGANVGNYKWDEKKVETGTATDQTFTMSGDKYEYKSSESSAKLEKSDSQTDTSFTVPAGSYPYTVDVNQTLGEWDATDVSMTDTLSSDKMKYIGYAKVEAREYNATTKAYDVKETKWVKIDGLSSFALKPSNLGWTDVKYAYKFTYYAKPADSNFSEVKVTNTFSLLGNVIRGNNKFLLDGISSKGEVTVSGSFKMNVKKESWYYEEPKTDVAIWQNGKLYWVIEVSGTEIMKNTYFRDAISKDSGLTDSYLHSDSLAGIYMGTLPDNKTIIGYNSLEELQKTGKLNNVTDKFTPVLTNGKNFTGTDNYSELSLQAKEQITLGTDKLYFIVRTEPQSLPTKYRDAFTYRNHISTSDDGKTWIDHGSADKFLCGGADILKELGQTFTYDGTTVTSKNDGADQGNRGTIVTNELLGAGQYAAWAFKVNYAGELSGAYRVLEAIPDGMELAYIRIKWVGEKQRNSGSIHSNEITGLDEGWKSKNTIAKSDNNDDISTTYYVKGNQALIELGDFVAGKERDSYSVDVQVVCRVTDPDVLLGGEEKTFMNHVTLQTADGQDLSTAISSATIEPQKKLDKQITDKRGEKITFTIEANPLGEVLPAENGTTLTLVDKLSSSLILDTGSIRVVNSKTNEEVTYKASFDATTNTLKIAIPCNVSVKISDEHLAVNTYYTVEQNATDNCTFELRFTDEFYKKYANDINNKKVQQILVHYAATVKSDAPINTAMNNKTWLTYGDKNTESNKSETNTYTFGIPVFKYTGSNKALEGAKFKLYTDERCDDDNNALKFKKNNDNKYRYVQTTTQDGDIILTSLKDGHIDIEGIKEGVYYLKEIEAPKGYNKLKDPIKVKISDSGQVSILKSVPGGTETSEAITDYVKVLNNTGTILPTTGGNGTSLIYFLGAVLALVSGVVLITKQRMKNS